MIIDLNRLYAERLINIDEDIMFDEKDESLGLKGVKDVHVKGYIKYNVTDDLELNLILFGKMILEDAINLEEILYDFKVDIADTLPENEDYLTNYLNKNQNTLDIHEILWQNIVLEVPIRARKDDKDISLEGEGWQLNKNIVEEIDPRLAPLQELINEGKE